jgi:uncharacterized repeat protein (TIGR03803 family)
MKPKRPEMSSALWPVKFLAVMFVIGLVSTDSAIRAGAQVMQILGTFDSKPSFLTLGNDGNFYGTTFFGGITNSLQLNGTDRNGMGTIFRATTNGTITTISMFTFTNGMCPSSGLTLGNDGNFYGTTHFGGITNSTDSDGGGTVFKVTTNGDLTSLARFSSTYGPEPNGLTLGSDGKLYGTTYSGGFALYQGFPESNYGTVFKATTNGFLGTLDSFNGSGTGALPTAPPAEGPDGNYYGTTTSGGYSEDGAIYKFGPSGPISMVASFSVFTGAVPKTGLTLGPDGNFYGTTYSGGSIYVGNQYYNYLGTLFQVGTNGTLKILVNFAFTNGAYPNTRLTLGSDGYFYGSTSGGGMTNSANTNGLGTVFRVTTNGILTTLAYQASSALTLGPDGRFYGVTSMGTNYPNGAIFRLLLPPTISVQPKSRSTNVGATVTFFCKATSLNTIGYQWQKNGANLADGQNFGGITSETLTISNATGMDAGNYSVVVSNADYGLTSSIASLKIFQLPQNFYAMNVNGSQLELQFTGTPNYPYILQSTTNLSTPVNWQPVLTNTTDGYGFWQFTDLNLNQSWKFYRVIGQ